MGRKKKKNPILRACEQGDLAQIKKLLPVIPMWSSIPASWTEDFKIEILDLLCEKGHIEILKYLVSIGFEAKNYPGTSWPLPCPASCGKLDMVKYFIELGANVSVDGGTAVVYACKNGHLDVVKYLLSLGVDLTRYYYDGIEFACEKGHLEIVKYFVSIGIEIDYREPIVVACREGRFEVVKYLVSIGVFASFEAVAESIENGHFEITKHLIENGTIDQRISAMISACKENSMEIVKFLLEFLKKDSKTSKELKNMGLAHACVRSNWDVIKFLISEGADVNGFDGIDHYIVDSGDVSLVKYMASLGTDFVSKDISLNLAMGRGNMKMVEQLISLGANRELLYGKYKEHFIMKRAYCLWRKIHLKKWIRRVLIPLYFSPGFPGEIWAKKELKKMIIFST